MKLSQLIKKLQDMQKKRGDVQVMVVNASGGSRVLVSYVGNKEWLGEDKPYVLIS
jgi:hypothetical protein